MITRHNLIEVDYKNKTAILENLDKPGTFIKQNVSSLNVKKKGLLRIILNIFLTKR